MNTAAAFRAVRSGQRKAAYYRMWHVRERAGLAWPEVPSPGAQVPFETALVALGKESGKLEECLRLLGDYFSAEDRLMLKVIKKAAYPMFVALAGAVIGPLPLIFRVSVTAYLVSAGSLVALWLVAGGSLLMGVMNRYLNQSKYVRGFLGSFNAYRFPRVPLSARATCCSPSIRGRTKQRPRAPRRCWNRRRRVSSSRSRNWSAPIGW